LEDWTEDGAWLPDCHVEKYKLSLEVRFSEFLREELGQYDKAFATRNRSPTTDELLAETILHRA
jgi:hypothetical protein